MFFLLSKTLDAFLAPLTWAFLFLAVAMLSRTRLWPKPGTRLRRGADAVGRIALPLTFVLLFVFSLEPVSNRMLRSLEVDAPSTKKAGVTYDAVILLGGLVEDRVDTHNGVAYNDNVERLHGTFDVLKRGEARFAILSGGSWNNNTRPEGETLADELERMGIARDRLIVEGTSRNTRENALFTADLVKARGLHSLLLVTSAFHMKRALRCFQTVGLDVDTLPVDYKSYDPSQYSGSLIPRSKSLHDSSYGVRELAGRVVYQLTGR